MKISVAKNAHLEAWKQTILQQAVDAAVIAAAQLGDVPPALGPVTVAQFLLESGWGQSGLSKKANNYFGMKARDGDPAITLPTHEVVHGQDVTVAAKFRRFDSMADCFAAHAKLLCDAPAYAKARTHGDDPIAFAHALTGVYATDPQYGAKLEAIMRDRGLLETFGFAAV
ncbi:MAG TPA: glucosaminidase domain-containing protein [Gemmatimonadaceae bacterium]|nr:glucosaminidase domain-containing protein [Gemmatimonadaceae bacterium]